MAGLVCSKEEKLAFYEAITPLYPKDYVYTNFTIKIHFDMDGVLAQWMRNPELVFDSLREIDPERFAVPDSLSREEMKEWASNLLSDVLEYEGDVKQHIKDLKAQVDELAKNSSSSYLAFMRDGYYRHLPPMENMVKAVNLMLPIRQIQDKNGVVWNVEYDITSCYPTESTAFRDKNLWINQYIPNMPARILVPYDEHRSGINKALAMGLPVPEAEDPMYSDQYLETNNKTVHVLFDDNTKVGSDAMQYGAQFIKCLNGINDTHKSYKGPRLDITEAPVTVASKGLLMVSDIAARVAQERFGQFQEADKEHTKTEKAIPPKQVTPSRPEPRGGLSDDAR